MGDEVKIKKDKKDKKEKKDKSDKKSKDSKKEKLVNADENRVHKSSSAEKTEKKKKDKLKKAAEGFLDGKMEKAERVVPVPSVNEGKMEVDEESAEESEVEKKAAADAGIEPVGSEDGEGRVLVPFAFPLANEKLTKKSLKCVKKGALILLLRCSFLVIQFNCTNY